MTSVIETFNYMTSVINFQLYDFNRNFNYMTSVIETFNYMTL